MTHPTILFVVLSAVSLLGQERKLSNDELQARFRELEARVAQLSADQQASNRVLKTVSELLSRLESGKIEGSCSQQQYPSTKVAFLEIVLSGCVGLASE